MVEIEIDRSSIQLLKMTDEEYFSSEYKDYISNSKLSLINPEEGGSFDKFETGFENTYSESYELGSAIHSSILQPDFYEISDLRKPNGKLGLFSEYMIKYRREGYKIYEALKKASVSADYYSKQFTEKRIKTAIKESLSFYLERYKIQDNPDKTTLYLSDSVYKKYELCMQEYDNSVLNKKIFPDGLRESPEVYNEYAILCEANVNIDGEITRVKLKAKLDNFTIDHEAARVTLNDLKTSGKKVSYFMGSTYQDTWYDGSFQKYRYYRQMGMYLWLLQCAIQEKFGLKYNYKANMLVIGTVPEDESGVKSAIYEVSNKYIKQGLVEFKKLLTLVIEWKKYQLTN